MSSGCPVASGRLGMSLIITPVCLEWQPEFPKISIKFVILLLLTVERRRVHMSPLAPKPALKTQIVPGCRIPLGVAQGAPGVLYNTC